MTDTLREVFDDMVADEPPLRMTVDDTEAAGRRLRARHRTLWTVSGAVLAVVLVVTVPALVISRGGTAVATEPTTTPPTVPTVSPSEEPLTRYRHCPEATHDTLDNRAGSVLLPDPTVAAAAVLAAGPRIAPGRQFLLNKSTRIDTSAKARGVPMVFLIFDIGDDDGFGSINMQIQPDADATPAVRAELALDLWNECVDVTRRDFPDGAVALYYPYGPPEQEAQVTHVWYFAAAGFTMNIGSFPQGWSAGDDPNAPPPPPSLPIRGSMPLTVGQIMAVADVVAHTSGAPHPS